MTEERSYPAHLKPIEFADVVKQALPDDVSLHFILDRGSPGVIDTLAAYAG